MTAPSRMIIIFEGGRYYPQLVRDDEDLALRAAMHPAFLRIEDVDGTWLWPATGPPAAKAGDGP
jgi:hypothetical protein